MIETKEIVTKDHQLMSEGMEHTVFRGKNPKFVIKKSRPFNSLLMMGRNRAAILRKELEEARTLVEKTTVKIPRTLIMQARERKLGISITRYLIGQRYVSEDNSIRDVRSHLVGQRLNTLVEIPVDEVFSFC